MPNCTNIKLCPQIADAVNRCRLKLCSHTASTTYIDSPLHIIDQRRRPCVDTPSYGDETSISLSVPGIRSTLATNIFTSVN
ncbi:hypothetical protein M8J77_018102 [Diaphorina citri]|nr:hypothetical protein M8J77_018102 [Diaphorina citri]